MSAFLENLLFTFQRLDWLGVVDILLVTLIFFGLLYLVRDTQAVVLLRGVILLLILIVLLTSLLNLPAFSWLVQAALPAMLLAIPVIFAPEIRRALERIGRAGTLTPISKRITPAALQPTIQAVVAAASRLSGRQHGALIVFQRLDSLNDYAKTGVALNARVTPELLLQTFYPNTPLHDGAVIIRGSELVAAACVLPLSASGILTHSPDRQMGLRHRAALGISEATDAVALVVSEESGAISITHAGRMIRRLDAERLENILTALCNPDQKVKGRSWIKRLFPYLFQRRDN